MTDLIRKNDALDLLCKFCGITEDVEKCRKTSADGWCKEYCELKNMPTVEAEPVRHGKWKPWDSDGLEDAYECTACGDLFVLIEGTPITNGYKYCPNCGARMDVEVET